jgi:hypothetical protein
MLTTVTSIYIIHEFYIVKNIYLENVPYYGSIQLT